MRTHWLTRKRIDAQHQIDTANAPLSGIKGFGNDGILGRDLAPVRAGVLHFDSSITASFDPISAGLSIPLIPGTDIYPEQPGAGGDYVPEGSPFTDFMNQAQPAAGRATSVARYFEGDLFTNGAMHMVYESVFERTPLQTIWGNAFLRTPNTFNPLHPPTANYANVVTNGIGGWIPGQMALQPLESEPT